MTPLKHNLSWLKKQTIGKTLNVISIHDLNKTIEELKQLLEETKNFTRKLSTQRTHAYNRGCYDMLKEVLGK